MDNVWRIVLENYMGEDDTIYFANYEIAQKNFNYLRDLNKDMPEFKVNLREDTMTWFDNNYNEYNTHVYLFQGGPKFYNEIVF
jgi:hypothetical protein